MYRVGDLRRKNRRRLKRRLIASAVIAGVLVFCYLIIFKNGLFFRTEGIPDTIVAVDTTKDKLPAITKADTKIDADTPKVEAEPIIKDTPIIPVYTDIVPKDEEGEPGDMTRQGREEKEVAKTTGKDKLEAETKNVETSEKSAGVGYKVKSVAYFYNEPDENTPRRAYINHWNNSYATLKASDERNGFIYVVFTNHLGQTSKGWLRKKDLKEVPSMAKNEK